MDIYLSNLKTEAVFERNLESCTPSCPGKMCTMDYNRFLNRIDDDKGLLHKNVQFNKQRACINANKICLLIFKIFAEI